MKITKISTNELELQEGRASGIAVGIVLIIAGVLIGIFRRASVPIAPWISLALAVVGIAIVLLSSSITVSASTITGQIRYQKKRLIGAEDATFVIADVFRIETRKEWRMQNASGTGDQNPTQPVIVAQSVIAFKDGRELALDHQKTSSTTNVGSTILMSSQGAETAMAAHLAKFLSVPFTEVAPPNMSAGINIISS